MKVLEISASGRRNGSTSRMLTAELIDAIRSRYANVGIARRDLADGVPLVDEAWITANFTPEEDLRSEQRDTLSFSDELVGELHDADVIVMGVPIYNFSIPAALKAWIDMIARARLTFRYTENGPVGLLRDKKAHIVVASGGVAVGSPYDFATPYLRQALAFVGISDIEFIAAERLNSNRDESIDAARIKIADLVFTTPELGNKAA
jgi:FMN-dependent NADH-azoreductase